MSRPRPFRKIAFSAGAGCGPACENTYFYSHKKIILILVDFLGITLYNVYYKWVKGAVCPWHDRIFPP